MPAKVQTPDVQVIDGEIRYGTSLYRVNETAQDQPLDQESAEFWVGDLRDVCNICDPKFKLAIDVKEKCRGKKPHDSLTIQVNEAKQLVNAAKRPSKSE